VGTATAIQTMLEGVHRSRSLVWGVSLGLGVGLSLTSCGPAPSLSTVPTDQAVVTNFVARPVQPTYGRLAERTAALQASLDQLGNG
jgi:hypothetical protein